MGRVKDLVIGVMGFTDMLSHIYEQKLQRYKKEMADLRTEKFLNEFNINYEKRLIPFITSYLSFENEEVEEYYFKDDKVIDLVMGHNDWNDLCDI